MLCFVRDQVSLQKRPCHRTGASLSVLWKPCLKEHPQLCPLLWASGGGCGTPTSRLCGFLGSPPHCEAKVTFVAPVRVPHRQVISGDFRSARRGKAEPLAGEAGPGGTARTLAGPRDASTENLTCQLRVFQAHLGGKFRGSFSEGKGSSPLLPSPTHATCKLPALQSWGVRAREMKHF